MKLKEIRTELFHKLTNHVIKGNEPASLRIGKILIENTKAAYNEVPEELEELEQKTDNLPDSKVYGEIACYLADSKLIEL